MFDTNEINLLRNLLFSVKFGEGKFSFLDFIQSPFYNSIFNKVNFVVTEFNNERSIGSNAKPTLTEDNIAFAVCQLSEYDNISTITKEEASSVIRNYFAPFDVDVEVVYKLIIRKLQE